jgi:transcriptional regulator with XRE-family HTH domain
MITGKQIGHARVLLGMSAAELAKKAGLCESTVRRAEQRNPKRPMSAATLEAIQRTLEAAGMEFSPQPAGCQAAEGAMTITGGPIKAARKLLGWSYATLAKKSRRSLLSVSHAELAIDQADHLGPLLDIQCALEAAGIEFTDAPGVRLRHMNDSK